MQSFKYRRLTALWLEKKPLWTAIGLFERVPLESVLSRRMQHMTNNPARLPQYLKKVGAFLLVASLALSMAGCAGKQPKQPSTVKEFLSQPRPQ